jgi:hypothetical protein
MSSETTATRDFSTHVDLPAETREQVIEMLNQHCQRALKTSQQWAQLKVENQPL